MKRPDTKFNQIHYHFLLGNIWEYVCLFSKHLILSSLFTKCDTFLVSRAESNEVLTHTQKHSFY
jgi:hypothetical protein